MEYYITLFYYVLIVPFRKGTSMIKQLVGDTPSVVAGYVRRSSHMQKDNFSIDAQKRAIRDECRRRNLPEPVFYEDDERSARSEQIARRSDFKRLL